MTPRPALWLYADMMMNRCVVAPVELLVFGYFCRCTTCDWFRTGLRVSAFYDGEQSDFAHWLLQQARLCDATMQIRGLDSVSLM